MGKAVGSAVKLSRMVDVEMFLKTIVSTAMKTSYIAQKLPHEGYGKFHTTFLTGRWKSLILNP